jgi:flavodoxin
MNTSPNGKTLVAYYSMSGNTRTLAEEIRLTLGADIDEIREPRQRRGFTGVIRALFDALRQREPPIEPPTHDPAGYDLLVLGGPIWAGRLASPVRTYAHRYATQAPHIAFFCTEGGNGGARAFAELERLIARAPDATLEVDARRLKPEGHREALQRFAAAVRTQTH